LSGRPTASCVERITSDPAPFLEVERRPWMDLTRSPASGIDRNLHELDNWSRPIAYVAYPVLGRLV